MYRLLIAILVVSLLCSCSKSVVTSTEFTEVIPIDIIAGEIQAEGYIKHENNIIIPEYLCLTKDGVVYDKEVLGKNNLPVGYSYNNYSGEESLFYACLYNSFVNLDSDAKIDERWGIDINTAYAIFADLKSDNPELWYINDDLTVETDDNGNVVRVSVTYNADKTEIEESNRRFQAIAYTIYSYLPNDASLYDTIIFVHDYLILNLNYVPNAESSLLCLLSGQADYNGFLQAFLYILKYRGIQPELNANIVTVANYNIDIISDIKNRAYSDFASHYSFGDNYYSQLNSKYIINNYSSFTHDLRTLLWDAVVIKRTTFEIYIPDSDLYSQIKSSAFRNDNLFESLELIEVNTGKKLDKSKLGIACNDELGVMTIRVFVEE